MLERVRAKGTEFRAETLRFVADPQIFTDVCELVCDAVYDYLYNDGFLDLPADWRARLSAQRPEEHASQPCSPLIFRRKRARPSVSHQSR